MKVTTKELFTQQYDVVGITMQFSLIEGENNKRGIFVMYTYDDFNNILSVSEWTTVNWMFGEMEKVAIEDIEKVESIKKINSFKDCWELTEEEKLLIAQREAIEKLINDKPEEVALLVKTWLAEE